MRSGHIDNRERSVNESVTDGSGTEANSHVHQIVSVSFICLALVKSVFCLMDRTLR